MASDIRRAIDAVWRIESARLIAGLARIVRDVGVAEDLAQDALVAALERWPASGVPDNPGAWLMAAARNRAIDYLRRARRLEHKHAQLGREIDERQERAESEADAALDDPVGDDLLRLVFTCCHPALATDARVALTLRLLGGLTTEEIARAFLVPVPTVAQRIVRAKRTLAEARDTFETPRGAELDARLASVLEVIYLVFNEGYAATAGDDWMRPALCEEALRLGRILAGLAPEEPEVHGLLALMELQASRFAARVGAGGAPVLLLDQDRARWDQLLIRRGLAALERAEGLVRMADAAAGGGGGRAGARGAGGTRGDGGLRPGARGASGSAKPRATPGDGPGPYAVQAAIAACHARARTAAGTDWARIVTHYDALARLVPSPVVELNRAVAVAMASGPAAGLALVDALASEPALGAYHLLPSVRGDLLVKLGRTEEARTEFERAASLTHNARERELLLGRAAACRPAIEPRAGMG